MEEKEDRPRKTQQSELVLVGFLFLFGIGGILFGVARLQGSIQAPFQLTQVPEQSGSLLDGVDQGGVDVEGMKSKDTDADGLNDYQETYITQTSAYLADTDGDGISDKEELGRGTNPSCAEGKTCFEGTPVVRTPTNAALPDVSVTDPSKVGGGDDPSQEVNKIVQQFQNKTPQEIRDFLKTQGLPESQLNQIPDALLQSIYSQGLTKAVSNIKQKGIGEQSGTQAAPSAKHIDPSTLTPQEIRTLLEQSGKVPLDILKKVPDSALKDIFMKAVQSEQQK